MISHNVVFSTAAICEDGAVLLSLTGELDIETAPVLHRVLSDLVRPETRVVTLNLAHLVFIDLAGLRALLAAEQTSITAGASFRLSGVDRITRRAMQLTGYQILIDAIADTISVAAA